MICSEFHSILPFNPQPLTKPSSQFSSVMRGKEWKRKMEKVWNKRGNPKCNKPRTLDAKSGIWPWGK